MNIYLDFDGTVVEHRYPAMGKYNENSLEVVKKLQDAGHRIILNTYRANCCNGTLQLALNMINESNKLNESISDYCRKKLYPDTFDWNVIKEKNELFIDDIATNIPLLNGMVDWNELDKQFIENKIY